MNSKVTKDMRQEVYARLVNLLGADPDKPISYAHRAVYEVVPYNGHLSDDWLGLEVHTDEALARMKELILGQFGNIQIEIRQLEVDRERLKENIEKALPPEMWSELEGKIEKIEQGKAYTSVKKQVKEQMDEIDSIIERI